MKKKNLVISYFEPFGEVALNSSEIMAGTLCNSLAEPYQALWSFKTICLPVSFEVASSILDSFLGRESWDALLMLGQAAKREKLSVELVAKNIMDPRFADNEGKKPSGEISPGGAAELASTWPTFELHPENVQFSKDAGEYVCNELFYRQLEAHAKTSKPIGFVHTPLLKPQAGAKFAAEDFLEAFGVILGAGRGL